MRALSGWMFVLVLLGAACEPTGEEAAKPPAESSVDASAGLIDNTWQWVSFSGPEELFEVDTPAQYRMTFNPDGTVSLKADCNNAGANYKVDGESLSFEMGISTMAYCPPESRSEQYLSLLGRASGFSLGDDTLRVILDDGAEMVFQPAQSEVSKGADPLGSWEWVSFQGMDDSSLEVNDPSRYTLEIREDGVSVLADCNRGNGGVNLEGFQLSFSEIATTRMACPPDSLADRYLSHLGYVRSWVIENGDLYLSLMADGGIMRFRPAVEGS